MNGLTIETADKFIDAAFHINSIIGAKNYDHSDFTSIMVGNTDPDNKDWARYIGWDYAIFKNNASKGYPERDRIAMLNTISGYGKLGLSVNWSPGSGGMRRGRDAEITEKYFGTMYPGGFFQKAFGGKESGNWEDEEVTKRFVEWSKTIHDITEIIPVLPFKKADKSKFLEISAALETITKSLDDGSSTVDDAVNVLKEIDPPFGVWKDKDYVWNKEHLELSQIINHYLFAYLGKNKWEKSNVRNLNSKYIDTEDVLRAIAKIPITGKYDPDTFLKD